MCHVLIIEDDWLIADHIAQLLERAGARSIDMAVSEREAVAQALTHPPDVIVSDVDLSKGGSGSLAVQRIVDALGERPVLFVTGEPRAFRPPSPAMRVVNKPFEDQALIAMFQEIAPLT